MTPITRQDILAHQAVVPWSTQHQVEQDLLLCRAMVALFDDDFLSGQIAMRGGTLLHKVHLAPASRYSEDIDLVVVGDRPEEHIRLAVRRVLADVLGTPKASVWGALKLAVRNAVQPSRVLKMTYSLPSIIESGRMLDIVVEANVTERKPHLSVGAKFELTPGNMFLNSPVSFQRSTLRTRRPESIMKNIIVAITSHISAALVALLALNASAATIYDNTSNDLLTRLNAGTLEIGDQIILAGTDRALTSFAFEYYGTNSANATTFAGANVEARVRFYENNGPPFNGYATPNNSFYDSDWFSIGTLTTARSTLNFTAGSDWVSGGLIIPVNEMTWSVQFRGMGVTDELGVDLYSPAAVGLNYPDYWANNLGTWSLLTNTVPVNFAAKFEAVPEPSSLALLVLGGLGLFAARSRGRKA